MAGFRLFGLTQDLLTTSLRVRAARHSVLSANIANADTPGYRPRDIDFARALQTAVHRQESPIDSQGQLTLVSTGTLPQPQPGLVSTEITDGEIALDGNRVELDSEITRMTENTLHHEASLTLLSRTLGGLRYAISEGRR